MCNETYVDQGEYKAGAIVHTHPIPIDELNYIYKFGRIHITTVGM